MQAWALVEAGDDEAIDVLWRKELKDRINAYSEGSLKSVSLEEVVAKYRS